MIVQYTPPPYSYVLKKSSRHMLEVRFVIYRRAEPGHGHAVYTL